LALLSYEEKPPTLEIPCIEGITVRMNLTQELILALCNMLQLSCKEAAWDIGAPAAQVQMPIEVAHGEKKVLH
jgi:hypothetical protein